VEGVEGAEESENHDGTEHRVAMRAENALGGEAEGEIVAGNLAHGENVENGGVDEEIDGDDGKQAGKNGSRDEVAGILDFVAEVDDAVPAVVSVDSGLNAEKESGDEGGADGITTGAAAWASGAASAAWRTLPPMVKQAMTMTKKTKP